MNVDQLKVELRSKRKSLADLRSYIGTQAERNPNYCLLLGAGCSVTSGVRSAAQLIEEWRRDVYESLEIGAYDSSEAKDYLKRHEGSWYNPASEYSSLFERKFDLPRQRRMFVEQEVDNKSPSIGYAYLVNLIGGNYFNAAFTTNFDDLLNEAFYHFSDKRPIVCAHDSAISSITVTSKRPKIIKLHGDYLFDDIKSSMRETESLEQNMKGKFVEFAKDHGLVVVGYSGCDRSIMDLLHYLLKQEDYLKYGIYWCLRDGDEISEDLRKLLWKDRVYFVVIDGFDEMMAELHEGMIGGIPFDLAYASGKGKKIIESYADNPMLSKSKSVIVKNHIEAIKLQSKRNTMVEELSQLSADDMLTGKSSDLKDEDVLLLMRIGKHARRLEYKQCVEIAEANLQLAPKTSMRINLYRSLVKSFEALGQVEQAIAACNSLMELQPKHPGHFLRKASLKSGFDERLALINDAIRCDPFFTPALQARATLLSEKCEVTFGAGKAEAYAQVIGAFDNALKTDPSIDNVCWRLKSEFIKNECPNRDEALPQIRSIAEQLEVQDANSPEVLRIRLLCASMEEEKEKAIGSVLSRILKAKEDDWQINKVDYDELYIDGLMMLDSSASARAKFVSVVESEWHARDVGYLAKKASFVLHRVGDVSGAIEILRQAFDIDASPRVCLSLFRCYLYAERYEDAKSLLDQRIRYLGQEEMLEAESAYYQAIGDYARALVAMDKQIEIALVPQKVESDKVYVLLVAQRCDDALALVTRLLRESNYDLKQSKDLINYELAKKRAGKIPARDRLEAIIGSTDLAGTKAAAYALLSKKKECLENIRKAVERDASAHLHMKKWPVFEEIRKDPEFDAAFMPLQESVIAVA